MGWLIGPFFAAFVVAWLAIGALQAAWSDANEAVKGTAFIGLFTSVFTAGATKKKNKTSKKYRPQVMSLRKRVDSKFNHK